MPREESTVENQMSMGVCWEVVELETNNSISGFPEEPT
jgi:hypothetical protein